MMPKVHSKNIPFDRALRIFRKKVDNSGILQEVRKREYYEKPTAVRKRKAAAAVKREAKNQRKNRLGRPPRF